MPNLSKRKRPGPHLPHHDSDTVHVARGGVGGRVVDQHLVRQVRVRADLRVRHGPVHLHHPTRADIRQFHVRARVNLNHM